MHRALSPSRKIEDSRDRCGAQAPPRRGACARQDPPQARPKPTQTHLRPRPRSLAPAPAAEHLNDYHCHRRRSTAVSSRRRSARRVRWRRTFCPSASAVGAGCPPTCASPGGQRRTGSRIPAASAQRAAQPARGHPRPRKGVQDCRLSRVCADGWVRVAPRHPPTHAHTAASPLSASPCT
jgi:hypothetical protein